MIYLASLSPRRCKLLKQINVNYQQIAVKIVETPHPNEIPQKYVNRMALAKAHAGRALVVTNQPVLAADTSIVCDDQLFGKPIDAKDAEQMLACLSGRVHQVMTAVALVTTTFTRTQLSVSNVHVQTLTKKDIQTYVATGEPFDKAGSYAIQGKAAIFIKRIEGSYSGIMGLPLYETATLLSMIND